MSLEVWKLHTYPTLYGIRRAEEQKDGVEVDHKEGEDEEELRSVSVLLSLLL